MREAVRAGDVRSAHDLAEGGFAVALAECCLAGGLGAQIDFALGPATCVLEQLFGEGPGGFLLSGPRPALAAMAREIPLTLFGVVGGEDLALALDDGVQLHWSLDELRAARDGGLAERIG